MRKRIDQTRYDEKVVENARNQSLKGSPMINRASQPIVSGCVSSRCSLVGGAECQPDITASTIFEFPESLVFPILL